MDLRRSWWRNHFIDHPGVAAKSPDAYVESDTGQMKSRKVYCGMCLTDDVRQILKEDQRARELGRVIVVRTQPAIEIYRELIDWFIHTIQQT